MRALRFEKTGSLDELGVRDIPVPKPAAGEVLVQVKAAAINPSDIKNVQGKIHGTTLPRTPGRDFAGIVVEGPPGLVGTSHPSSGRGETLDSGATAAMRNFSAVPAQAVLPLPRTRVSFEQGAGIGVAYMTAWDVPWRSSGPRPENGETVLITGTPPETWEASRCA